MNPWRSNSRGYKVGKTYSCGAVRDGKVGTLVYRCVGYDENGIARFEYDFKEDRKVDQ